MHVVVVVLGDVGRSPRMQYHSQSLLDTGHSVTLVGYTGEAVIPSLSQHPRCRLLRFENPQVPTYIPSILYYPVRVILLAYALFGALGLNIPNDVDFVLVQNPPALPSIVISWIYCHCKAFYQRRRRPGLIIDWHNLGFSMFSSSSLSPKLLAYIGGMEMEVASFADGHLTVTKAMKEYLESNLPENASKNMQVLYDQPPERFTPLPIAEQHQVLLELQDEITAACPPSWTQDLNFPLQTLFTEQFADGGTVHPRAGRPALVTSSTSWTPDEDFGILLDALSQLDRTLAKTKKQNCSARILVLVTGKGPQRATYQARMEALSWTHVAVSTLWVTAEQYPRLLACADVGVSLHTSTSGLDLPMKILDLFGCGVPVVAYRYPTCQNELVQEFVTGRCFETWEELHTVLQEVLGPLLYARHNERLGNHGYGVLQQYARNLEDRPRWAANWMEHALPVILRATPKQ